MDEGLWSTRNIAEYAYCPRLFYLMEVEGLHLENRHTEEGQVVHRRVDKPSAEKAGEEDPEKPKAVRSLALTSNRIPLTATLDLAELEGMRATPVEYRKGRPRHPAAEEPDDLDLRVEESLEDAEPWPTDRVQLALQAMLLREHGYQVEEGVLYYAEERRRVRVPIGEELMAEALGVYEAAVRCANGERPAPLVRDGRCRGCSMQPLCLPDEVNAEEDGKAPRNLWPPREEGAMLVVQKRGARVGVRGMALRVETPGEKAVEQPIAGLESLALVGGAQISAQALQTLTERHVPVAFMTGAGRLVAMTDPLDSVSAKVRRAQVLRLEDGEERLLLGRPLIVAKIQNQRTLILRNARPAPEGALGELDRLREAAAQARSSEELMGFEGRAAAVYFPEFARLLTGEAGEEFGRNGRKRRPAPDPVNACLSLAYTMLAHECTAALRLGRLEPSLGGLHTCRPGRPALALDLMEPFRPLIADSLTLASFNRGEFRPGHFLKTAAGCTLSEAGRKVFFGAWARRMETEVRHQVYEYRLSYRRMLILHARLMAAWMLGEVKEPVFLTTR